MSNVEKAFIQNAEKCLYKGFCKYRAYRTFCTLNHVITAPITATM